MKLFKTLVWTQSTYMLITAVWPLVDIKSFMVVTGPKTDIWLVKTVGALLIPVSLTLFYQSVSKEKITAIILGGSTALAFMSIDFYYALNDTISDVYLADGFLQLIFFIAWLFVFRNYTRHR
jgi:hypothetical protein